MPYNISACGLSDIGLVRQNNEDVWAELPEYHTYVLADGMGGHKAGEVAASKTVMTFCELMHEILKDSDYGIPLEEMEITIKKIIKDVNAIVYEMGCREYELKGMGTTFCCLHFHPKGLIYAHVGDSRIYCLRKNRLKLLTRDHSLLRELIDMGQISQEEARDFVYRNIITKAVGTEPSVEPSVEVMNFQVGDLYLICSDGLSDLLSLSEIEAIVSLPSTIYEKTKKLIAAAKDKGGHDNITVVVMEVQEKPDEKDIPR